MLSVVVADSLAKDFLLRRVVLFGPMETADVPALVHAIPRSGRVAVRLVAERIWRCEPECLRVMLAGARHVRGDGGSFVWVMPAPMLRCQLDAWGELGCVVPADDLDRRLSEGWGASVATS